MCHLDTSRSRAFASFESQQSFIRICSYRKRETGRQLWVPFLSCLQFLRVSLLPAFFLQTTLVKYFHSMLGRPELLYPHLFRCTLPGRLIGRYVRRAEWCADLLLFTALYPSPKENRRIIEIRRTQPLSDRTPERDRPYPPHDLYRIDYHRNHSDNLPSDHPAPIK